MPPKAQTLHVSIVDDDDSVRKGLSRLMRSAGIQSQAYGCPEDFLAQAHNQVHACIIIDLTMPRMNGLELSAQLRAKGITVPVIAISARDDDVTRQLARDLGVKFFLRKPVDDQALLDAISWVVHEDMPDHQATPRPARP
ncbi:MAG: response regulator [Burkholderiaceae bacterium]|nr:response regulator [Burkholderiaceae bacterium]